MQYPVARGDIGSQVENHDAAADEEHTALDSIVAGIAVLEIISALQLQPPLLIANWFEARNRDGIVKKLETLRRARGPGCVNSRFTHLDAVEPERGDGYQSKDADDFRYGHGVFWATGGVANGRILNGGSAKDA